MCHRMDYIARFSGSLSSDWQNASAGQVSSAVKDLLAEPVPDQQSLGKILFSAQGTTEFK